MYFGISNHQKWFETTHKGIISQTQNVWNWVSTIISSKPNYLKLLTITMEIKKKTCNYHKTSDS